MKRKKRLEKGIESIEEEIEIHKKKIQKESGLTAEKMKSIVLTITRRTNEEGKMFGSITSVDIAQELSALGYSIHRHDIEIHSIIKEAGTHQVKVRLPGDVYVPVELVVKIELDKKAQDKGKKRQTQKKETSSKQEEVKSSKEAPSKPTE